MSNWIKTSILFCLTFVISGMAAAQAPGSRIEPPAPLQRQPPAPQQDFADPNVLQEIPGAHPIKSDRCNGARKHCVWVSPHFDKLISDGGALRSKTDIWVLNPGGTRASIACYFLVGKFADGAPGTLVYEPRVSRVDGGLKGKCPQGHIDADGWVLVAANQPVFPFGFISISEFRNNGRGQRSTPLAFYPVNCAEPAGVEFVCNFLSTQDF